jgi:hypothetical protein
MEFLAETEKMREFMTRITPKNWNIYSNGAGKYICDIPGTLNVFLSVKEMPLEYGPPYLLGAVIGPMSFVRLNNVMTARVEVCMYLNEAIELFDADWRTTLIHELAHVAEFRWMAFRKKAHRTEGDVGVSDLEEVQHGPVFQRALVVMLNRAVAAFGEHVMVDDVLPETVRDLDYYEYVDPRWECHGL